MEKFKATLILLVEIFCFITVIEAIYQLTILVFLYLYYLITKPFHKLTLDDWIDEHSKTRKKKMED